MELQNKQELATLEEVANLIELSNFFEVGPFLTVILSLLRDLMLPAGSTYTGGAAYVPAFTATGAPYDLIQLDVNEPAWPGMLRVTTTEDGADLGPELASNLSDLTLTEIGGGTIVVSQDGKSAVLDVPIGGRAIVQILGLASTDRYIISGTYTVNSGTPSNGSAVIGLEDETYTESTSFSIESVTTSGYVRVGIGCSNVSTAAANVTISDISIRKVLPIWLNDDGSGNLLHPEDVNGNLGACPPRENLTVYAEGDEIFVDRHWYTIPAGGGGTSAASAPDFNILGSIDFTAGWSTLNTVVDSATQFTSSAAGGVYKDIGLTPGNTYLLAVRNCSTTASGFKVVDSISDSVPVLLTGNGYIEYTATSTGIYFRNDDAGVFTLGQVELIAELTTDGTVIWEHQGNYNPHAGLSSWPNATNFLLNSDTPATQTTGSLGTGNYTLWVNGTGSATLAANTATIDAGGVATDGSVVNFNVTVAGTVDVTVDGSLDRFQLSQLGGDDVYIPTTGTTATLTLTDIGIPTAQYFREQDCGVRMMVRPNSAGQTCDLLGIGDTISITPTTVNFDTLSHSYTHSADTEVEIDLYYDESGRGLRTREPGEDFSAWTEDAVTTGVTLPEFASVNDGFDGEAVKIQTVTSNSKASLEALPTGK